MWENTIELLKKKGVIVDKGLSDAEIGQIEQLYKIRVPQILQDLWKEGLPISKSFYNWRDFTPRNIGKIKSAMDKPILSGKRPTPPPGSSPYMGTGICRRQR